MWSIMLSTTGFHDAAFYFLPGINGSVLNVQYASTMYRSDDPFLPDEWHYVCVYYDPKDEKVASCFCSHEISYALIYFCLDQ